MKDIKQALHKSLNLGIEGSEVVQQEVEILDEDNSASAEAIDSIGDHATVKDLEADATELEAIEEDGEALVAAVECAIATGKGLTPFEGAALRLAMKQITGRYGKMCSDALPAREEYGGTADAHDSTVLAVEEMKNTFATFWAAAKEQFLKLVEGFQKMFRSVVQRFSSVAKRAQAVKARVGEMDGKSGGQVKIHVAGLNVTGNIPEDTVKGLADINKVASALLAATRSLDGRAQVSKGLTAIRDPRAWKDFVDSANMETGKVFSSLLERQDTSGKFTEYLPGKAFLAMTSPEEGTREQFTVEYLLFDTREEGDGTGMVEALTADQIESVATSIISIAETIEEYQKVWGRTSSKAAHLVTGIEKAAKAFEKESENNIEDEANERAEHFKVNAAAFIRFVKNVEKLPADFVYYAQKASNAALTYAELSLNSATQQAA